MNWQEEKSENIYAGIIRSCMILSSALCIMILFL